MNLLNILHSIEGTVFEIATWVIYLPKTFIQTFRHPRWIQGYVMQEWDFDADKRFQTYMSPVLYWLIAGVLPIILVLYGVATSDASASATGSATLLNLFGASFEARLGTLAFIQAISPLLMSAAIRLQLKAPLDKEALRPLFYTQTMCFGTANLLLSLSLIPGMIGVFVPAFELPGLVMTAMLVIASVVWLVLAEEEIIKWELADTTAHAMRTAIITLLITTLVALLAAASVGAVGSILSAYAKK